MKEATGDMTMTIVVIVGIVFVLALAKPIWNAIGENINEEVTNIGYVETIETNNI